MNKEILILIGISGSGKSTFTTNFIKENSNYLRINRDSIRLSLVGDLKDYYNRKDLQQFERIVNNLEDKIFDQAIGREFNIIVDNTNLKQEYISRWLNMINFQKVSYAFEYDIKFKLFDTISLSNTKNVVKYRDSIENVDYIDKQFIDYQRIRKWINENHKDRIII